MNVLVTGAKGFIGSTLCYKLSTDNKVIGVDIAKSSEAHAKITQITQNRKDVSRKGAKTLRLKD